mmetsp:Transcript_2603/g.5875  ORF Transcript_2603/g.5875 Transcript_2603/m.5875 type:complete len:227 (-) Transcript_2603:273-953(-)
MLKELRTDQTNACSCLRMAPSKALNSVSTARSDCAECLESLARAPILWFRSPRLDRKKFIAIFRAPRFAITSASESKITSARMSDSTACNSGWNGVSICVADSGSPRRTFSKTSTPPSWTNFSQILADFRISRRRLPESFTSVSSVSRPACESWLSNQGILSVSFDLSPSSLPWRFSRRHWKSSKSTSSFRNPEAWMSDNEVLRRFTSAEDCPFRFPLRIASTAAS